MPNVTLITGGPRSGKTEALVGRLAGLYNDNPFGQAVALVPTVRHGDQFRRRLVERCGVALGLRVETISQFSLGLVSGAWMPSYALVDELLTRTIRSQVESGPAVYFWPISGTKGLSNLVRSAVAYLLSEVIAPQALSEASSRAGSDSLVALSAIYAAYANDLEQREWVHPAQIGLTAARVVRADAELPAVIVLDGFHLFRGAELVLLQALAERADVTISLDPDASARSAHDYQRLLRLFPNVEVVDLERGANGASSNVLARDAGDREGQLRLLREADSPEPLGHGSDDSRTVIARETSDRGGQLRLFPDTEPVETQGHRTNDPPTVIAGEAADREGQLRAMARQIKQRLTEQPTLRPSDCAVSFRQASPYLGLARQIFAEYNLPLDPAAGERLNSRPLGVWLRRLLHLGEDGWRVRDVAAVLSSGFVDLRQWNLYPEDVARFTKHSRENHIWSGDEAIRRALDGLRIESEKEDSSEEQSEAKRRTSAGMSAALDALQGLLEQPAATTAEHARSLEEALFGAKSLLSASSRENPGVDVEMDALRGYLRDLAATHEALGGDPEEFVSFRARVEAKLDAPSVVIREAGGVLMAPMHTLHGLRFDFVAVGGLIAGEFPAPRTSAGLLSTSARNALNAAGLGIPPEARLTEDELWQSVSSRADSAMGIWRSRLDQRGRPASASYYFPAEASERVIEQRSIAPQHTSSKRELAIACSQDWSNRGRRRPMAEPSWPVVRLAAQTEAQRRSFNHAGEREGLIPPGLADRLVNSDAVWSASRIESYRTCAFQFFGQYGLGLRELDQESQGVDAATRGTVIHEVLQDALGPLIEKGDPLTPSTLVEAEARLHANGINIWNAAPSKYGFGRAALWRLDFDNTLSQIEKLLQREAERSEQLGVTHIRGAERTLEALLPLDPPLRIRGTIDRIDAGDGFVVIVDYKSGRSISATDVMEGRRVQLQLYGYLGKDETHSDRIVARYAWVRPDIPQWELDSAKEPDAVALDQVLTVAQEVREAVSSGDFRVNPQVPCPTYCSMRHACRVNQFTRWKRWE